MLCLQRPRDTGPGALAHRHGIHNFAAAIYAVAAGEVPRIGSLTSLRVHNDAAVLQVHATAAGEKIDESRLADRWNDHIAGNLEIRTGNRFQIGADAHAFNALDGIFAVNFHRQCPPVELHAVQLGDFVFVIERGHLSFTAAIEHVNFFRAEAVRGRRGVNGSVACTDDGDAAADGYGGSLVGGDELERIHDAG